MPTYASRRLSGRSVASVTTGTPAATSRPTASTTSGWSGALSSTPCEPRRATSSSVAATSATGPSSRSRKRPRTTAGAQQRQLGLERRADLAGEPPRRPHHEVDEERPPREPHLVALPVEVDDRLLHLGHRAGPDAGPLVEDPVDGGEAQPGLLGDLAEPVGVPRR